VRLALMAAVFALGSQIPPPPVVPTRAGA